MAFFKIMIALVLIILAAMLFVRVIDEWKYSYKIEKTIDGKDAVCYWDRGWFNIPLAKICYYNNDTVIIKKEKDVMVPRRGEYSIFPNGSWIVRR